LTDAPPVGSAVARCPTTTHHCPADGWHTRNPRLADFGVARCQASPGDLKVQDGLLVGFVLGVEPANCPAA
jgi:hypothetical protein